jgi:hypothetical protein
VTKRKRVDKVEKTKRVNNTRHFRAVLNPKVKEFLTMLRADWAVMAPSERGQCIVQLISLGCSRRGLGRELGVSATNIRKHAEIVGLPEFERKAIDSGASAKDILTLKATAERQTRERERIDDDKRTGALSNKIATTILEFCRAGKELRKDPMIRGAFPMLLDKVGERIRHFEAIGHRAVRVSKKLESRELFRKTRPRGARSIPALAHQATWLAQILWLMAPESPIREMAILKARKLANELLPRRTLPEMIEDIHVDSIVREIELTHGSPRKFYPGGAAAFMQRQGPALLPSDPNGSRNKDSKA